MNVDMEDIPQRVIFNVTSLGLRLVPRGKHRTFCEGGDLYELFCSMYGDVHPEITQEIFISVLKEIFPVYKNPRKNTDEYKITTHKLDERLSALGMRNFPVETLIKEELLKIEM